MSIQRSLWCFLSAAAAIAVAGCGGQEVYPASGSVVYENDDPLPGGAIVVFEPAPGSRFKVEGEIRSDGSFTLVTTDDEGDTHEGAPAGEYRVFIVPVPGNVSISGETGETEASDEPVEVTAVRYGDPETSRITVEIKPEENTGIVIRVERPVAPP